MFFFTLNFQSMLLWTQYGMVGVNVHVTVTKLMFYLVTCEHFWLLSVLFNTFETHWFKVTLKWSCYCVITNKFISYFHRMDVFGYFRCYCEIDVTEDILLIQTFLVFTFTAPYVVYQEFMGWCLILNVNWERTNFIQLMKNNVTE